MQKFTQIVSTILILCLLAGCQSSQKEDIAHHQNVEVKQLGGTSLCAMPLSAATVYQLTTNTENINKGFHQYVHLDYLQCAEVYVNNATIVNEFVQNYNSCDFVEAYPVLGTYLEPTNLVVYLFYTDNCPTGIASLTFDQQGNVETASSYADMTTLPPYVEALSLEDCYMAIVHCQKSYPEFDILGVIFDTNGYPAIYPVGMNAGESTIKYVAGEPQEFSLVDPFETLEEGYAAFDKHLRERQQIFSEIMLYPWSTTEFYELGYIREFTESVSVDTKQISDAYAYLEDYDSLIAIPLLSEDFEENVYILHLLYYHNQLIAEVVIERISDGSTSTYNSVWERVAPKSADGAYFPMDTSQYVNALGNATSYSVEWNNVGVIFNNGQFQPIGMYNDVLMVYDLNTNTIDAVE